MGTFLFWNELLTSKILAVSLFIDAIAMLILNDSACATGLYDWSKSITLIWELPFLQWRAKNFHALEQSHSLIIVAMIQHRNFVPSGRNLIGIGSKRRLPFLFLSYWKNRDSFQNCLWGTFKPLPIFFGVGGLFGRRTSRCENTGLNWSNMERISSRSILW